MVSCQILRVDGGDGLGRLARIRGRSCGTRNLVKDAAEWWAKVRWYGAGFVWKMSAYARPPVWHGIDERRRDVALRTLDVDTR